MTAFAQIDTFFSILCCDNIAHDKNYPARVRKRSCFGFLFMLCCHKHGWRCPDFSLKISSGFTLANVWIQSWTAVTSLAAFSPSCSSTTIFCAFHCKSYAICDITCNVKMPIWHRKQIQKLNLPPTLYYCWFSWFQTLLPQAVGDFRLYQHHHWINVI